VRSLPIAFEGFNPEKYILLRKASAKTAAKYAAAGGLHHDGKFLQPPEGSPVARSLRLIHRLAVFALAILYVEISLHSFSTAMVILQGSVSHDLAIETHSASLINGYAGTATIQASPLVQQVLHGSTDPLDSSLYLQTTSTQSSTGCTGARLQCRDLQQRVPALHLFQTADSRLAQPVVRGGAGAGGACGGLHVLIADVG